MTKEVNGNERVPLPTPAWHQTEKTAKISGVALIIIGSLGTLASIGLMVAAAPLAPPLIVAGVFGLAASISAIAGGIVLLRKECWKDPVFVDKVAKQAQKMTLDQVVETFGWDRIAKQHFISKRELTDKLLQRGESYSQLVQKYPSQIKNQLFINKDLRPVLMKEIEERKLTVKSYKEIFGDQPINDKILTKDDPWLQSNLSVEIRDKSYAELKAQYENIITPSQIREEMLGQLQRKGFMTFYKDNESNFYSLIIDGILTAQDLRDSANESVAFMDIKSMVNLFGHDLFTKGILNGFDFKEKFEQETLNLTLWEMFRAYPLIPLLKTGMTSKETLRMKSNEMHTWTFDQIIERYGWGVFEQGIILGSDVQNVFKEKVRSLTFTNLWNNLGSLIEKYNLFDANLMQYAKSLLNNKNNLEISYNQQLKMAKSNYEAQVSSAKARSNMLKLDANRQVDSALYAYNVERQRHGFEQIVHRHDPKPCRDFRRMNHIISATLLEMNYLNALSQQETVYATAEAEYSQAVANASENYQQSLQLASRSRELGIQQIEESFKLRLAA